MVLVAPSKNHLSSNKIEIDGCSEDEQGFIFSKKLNCMLACFESKSLALIVLFGFVICYWPLISNWEILKDRDSVSSTMKSYSFDTSLVVSIAISIPVIMEFILDLLFSSTTTSKQIYKRCQLPRTVLIFSLFVPNLIIYLIANPSLHATLLLCTFQARKTLFVFGIVGHLREHEKLTETELSCSAYLMAAGGLSASLLIITEELYVEIYFKLRAQTQVIETIDDIKESCEIAVEILNDLLNYEKLEAGIMILEIEEIKAYKLLKAAIKPFYLQ
eukprot:gene12896-27201_t